MLERRTFDCTYGRHALVLRRGYDGPAFGRIDVIKLGVMGDVQARRIRLTSWRAAEFDSLHMPRGYSPRHAR